MIRVSGSKPFARNLRRVCRTRSPSIRAVGDSDYEIAIRLHICASNTNHSGIIPIVPSQVCTS